jgi:uncharacterized protein
MTNDSSTEPADTADDGPFTDAEIDRLEELLDAPNFDNKAYPVDALQGFLCAVLSGPRIIPADEWIPVVLGGTPRYASDEQADEVESLLMRFHDSLASELRSDEGISLILYPIEEGSEVLDYANWSLGYLEGVDLGEPDWTDLAGEDELNDLLMPFLVLGGELGENAELRAELDIAEDEHEAIAEDARENFVDYILEAHDFWLGERYKPETFKRDVPKVGRNDPCPCGSGRKYKACHGAT